MADTLPITQGEDDTVSKWSCVRPDHDTESSLCKIAQLQEEHSMLRNQMAALAQQPIGQQVHDKATVIQSEIRRHALRTYYLRVRAATIKVQTAHRCHKQYVKWNMILATFPERSKVALLLRALDEKQLADKEKDKNRELLACLNTIKGYLQSKSKNSHLVPDWNRNVGDIILTVLPPFYLNL